MKKVLVGFLSAEGVPVTADAMIGFLESKVKMGCKIFIGTDSMLNSKYTTMVTTVCLHCPRQKIATYFFKREKIYGFCNKKLKERILKEVEKSIDVFMLDFHKLTCSRVELFVPDEQFYACRSVLAT